MLLKKVVSKNVTLVASLKKKKQTIKKVALVSGWPGFHCVLNS